MKLRGNQTMSELPVSLNPVTLKVYNEIMGAHFRFDRNHVGVPDEAYMEMAKAAISAIEKHNNTCPKCGGDHYHSFGDCKGALPRTLIHCPDCKEPVADYTRKRCEGSEEDDEVISSFRCGYCGFQVSVKASGKKLANDIRDKFFSVLSDTPSEIPDSVDAGGYHFTITDIEKPYYAKPSKILSGTLNQVALNAAIETYREFPEQGDMRLCAEMMIKSYLAASRCEISVVKPGTLPIDIDKTLSALHT
jgi:DNA-directed RNA polymerase subunit RPC12/RpoP